MARAVSSLRGSRSFPGAAWPTTNTLFLALVDVPGASGISFKRPFTGAFSACEGAFMVEKKKPVVIKAEPAELEADNG